MGIFRPKDRNYTSEEAERKANGYAMEYIIKIKGSIEDVVKSISDVMIKYFNDADGQYHKDMANKADKSEIPDISVKADKATTLSGYGITDSYTKTETNEKLNQKANEAEGFTNRSIMHHYNTVVLPEINDKVKKDLSNVDKFVFKKKAEDAGVAGAVKSVNGKTGDVVLTASEVGAYTKDEIVQVVDERIAYPIGEIQYMVDKKAENDLSNVSNEDFLSKLNEVLPDGDGVSY